MAVDDLKSGNRSVPKTHLLEGKPTSDLSPKRANTYVHMYIVLFPTGKIEMPLNLNGFCARSFYFR